MILITSIIILFVSFTAVSFYTFYTIRYRNGDVTDVTTKSGLEKFPTVSILEPVRNIDDDVEKNLESLFSLDYPHFEILFGVDSHDDPIIEIIEKLRVKYPEIESSIIITGHSNEENPKIYKLAFMENAAVGELFWVCDSNIRVEKDTLHRLVSEYFTNNSKIIFSPVRSTGSSSFGSIIENSYFNLFLSGSVITAWKLFKKQIVVGKSMLIEKETLNHFGGFTYFKDYLAEDYMMGETYTESKFPISTNCTWVTNYSRDTSIKSFYYRMERWAKLRFRLKFHFYILEIILNPIVLALFFAAGLGGKKGLILFTGSLMLKIFLEYTNFLFLNPGDRKKFHVLLRLPFAILVKDLILFAVYFAPFFSSTVNWRGGEISIGKKTLIALNQESLLYYGA
ncbi:MAG: glycosyltransferase [Acidobacteria bacterium]|jgi:ceramide glucosyltransferase|nr:glycosyltransferase [Acidobacteriota bacterium]